MNVIRMIKLFGWEPRITAQLNEKRAEELISVRKARILGMSNMLCKYVSPLHRCAYSGASLRISKLPDPYHDHDVDVQSALISTPNLAIIQVRNSYCSYIISLTALLFIRDLPKINNK